MSILNVITLIFAVVLLVLVLSDKVSQKIINIFFLIILILMILNGSGWIGQLK